MKKLVFLVLAIGFGGCVESDIVTQFSSSQVEQLLTDGEIKTWFQSELIIDGERQSLTNCSDSVRWVFEIISTDSISSYELILDNQCILYDTTFLGSFEASNFEEIFTDSLKFEGGNKSFMTPRFIRSSTFSVSYTDDGRDFIATFNDTRSDLLARQVDYYLTGGIESGDSKDWYLTSLSIDNLSQSFINCSDSNIFRFTRQPDFSILLSELETDTVCIDYVSTLIGTVSVPFQTNEGFFENELNVDGNITELIEISNFTDDSFSARYLRNDATYSATYDLKKE